ncbi:MAG: hypothetical protein JWM53_6333 [bacterium]|nr:hypothetical protein [bacterium]
MAKAVPDGMHTVTPPLAIDGCDKVGGGAMHSRATPIPPSWSVRAGRDAYLMENGFTVAAYDAKWTGASFLGLRFAVPNTRRHRWAIMMHDLHHVATGYGTDLSGEGEISGWELRRGLGRLGLYVGGIVFSGALMGLFVAPWRALAAWRASSRRASLFQSKRSYDELLAMTVGELRAELGIPVSGIVDCQRGLHSNAPKPALGNSD